LSDDDTMQEKLALLAEYIEYAKEHMEMIKDRLPPEVWEAYRIIIRVNEIVADPKVAHQEIREAIFEKVPQEKLLWAQEVITKWQAENEDPEEEEGKKRKKRERKSEIIAVDKKRGFELKTPLPENGFIEKFKKLFPKKKSISLLEVFKEINTATDFLSAFEPLGFYRKSKKPDPIYFYATLLERTKRKNFSKIAGESEKLPSRKLKDVFLKYFTPENLQEANMRIFQFIQKLEVSALPETGISPYYFRDKKNFFPPQNGSQGIATNQRDVSSCSMVICCSEMEFPYALDTLVGNPTAPLEEYDIFIKSPADCAEVYFGIADLLGYSYAISITDFSRHKIYSMENMQSRYLIPDAAIDMRLVTDNWDKMLRFAATIKTKYTPASILIPKLINRFDDPMFLGLRELGKIKQTIFILNYIDTLDLRQTIETHLEKADFHKELARKIQKPLGKNEFITHENRIINDGCKILLENCILAWNLLYLAKKGEKSKELIDAIQSGFVPVWEHIDIPQ